MEDHEGRPQHTQRDEDPNVCPLVRVMVVCEAAECLGELQAPEDRDDCQYKRDVADTLVQNLPGPAKLRLALVLLWRVRPDEGIERLQPAEDHDGQAQAAMLVVVLKGKLDEGEDDTPTRESQPDDLDQAVQLEPIHTSRVIKHGSVVKPSAACVAGKGVGGCRHPTHARMHRRCLHASA